MIASDRMFDSHSQSAAVAQSVERHIGNVEVTGPIPVSSFRKSPKIKGFSDMKNERYSKKYSRHEKVQERRFLHKCYER